MMLLLKVEAKTIIVVDEEELIEDMLQIVTVFSARLYGIRSYKSKIDKIN